MSIFWLYASELVILIVFAIRSVLTLGHGTVLREEYHPDNPTFRSKYFEENNIEELKAKPHLKELAPNINRPSADLPSK